MYSTQETEDAQWKWVGQDVHYYQYELSDIDVEKSVFPKDREVIAFSNGEETIAYDPKNGSYNVEMPTLQEGLAIAMRLKQARPDLPITVLHNHPAANDQSMNYLYKQNPTWAYSTLGEAEQVYNDFSLAPSMADMQLYGMIRNFANGAIYHQADDSVRTWMPQSENTIHGTKLGIRRGTYGTSLYWAQEEENLPDTEYIKPEEWDSKQHLVEGLDWMNFSYYN